MWQFSAVLLAVVRRCAEEGLHFGARPFFCPCLCREPSSSGTSVSTESDSEIREQLAQNLEFSADQISR